MDGLRRIQRTGPRQWPQIDWEKWGEWIGVILYVLLVLMLGK